MAALKFNDEEYRKDLLQNFLVSYSFFLHCKCSYDVYLAGLQSDQETFVQLLCIKNKSPLSESGEKLYDEIYKALEGDPAQWKAEIETDISDSEEALRKDIVRLMEKYAIVFILSPFSQLGDDSKVIDGY